MPYIAKKPGKINFKVAIPILVAILVVAFFSFQFLHTKKEDAKRFQICGLNADKTQEELQKKAKDTYVFNDYFYYGETLNLLQNAYNPEENDNISGKSILLKDVCSNKEYAFVVGSTIDSAILLNNVEKGFYRVYVVENLIEKQAVMGMDVKNSIKTINRNGSRRKVSLLASQEYFKEKEIQEKENYVYLQVQDTTLAKDEYDIAIDPAGSDYDFTYTLNRGSEGNGLVEMEETYTAAELLAAKLEEKGLKVLVVRNKDEEINSYGKDGRLARAYHAKAKYYLRLSFSESVNNYEGMDVAYSAHSSNMFANQIIYHLKRNSDVTISNVYSLGQNDGYYSSILLKGIDNRQVYDSDLWIREAGGKATMAGMYSENAQEGTSSFAKDSMFGMNALDINLGYLTNVSDANFWKENKDAYMGSLAEAIKNYLSIEE